MAVKIRLKRLGKVRVPQYRIVVVDSRKKRDGKVIEEIGLYHPKEDPSYIKVTSDRAQYWLGVGAQPSDAVAKLLKLTGDWQTYKGLTGTEGTLRTAEAKRDKLDVFNEALKEVSGDTKSSATTKKAASKKAEKKAESDDDQAAAPTGDTAGDKPATTAKATKAEKAAKADKKAEAKADEPKAEDTPAEETPTATPEPREPEATAGQSPEDAATDAEADEATTEPGN